MGPLQGRCAVALRSGGCKRVLVSLSSRQCLVRSLARPASSQAAESQQDWRRKQVFELWNKYGATDASPETQSDDFYFGFIGKRRHVGSHLSFADLTTPSGEVVQICSNDENDSVSHEAFRRTPAFAPVRVTVRNEAPAEEHSDDAKRTLYLRDIQPLNAVPTKLVVTPDVQFPKTMRHLQLRFHPELQARLRFRSWLKGVLSQDLLDKGFVDVETPTLFKSTPEGAREFLVPTRQGGMAYALSQSPQQYKQILMASGIMRYMQWARCYRDEDLRTDRQPEFTQLDMEWAFAGAAKVMEDVTGIILNALSAIRPSQSYRDVRRSRIPIVADIPCEPADAAETDAHQFTTITFADSIAAYGTDKPDLRIPNRIHAIKDLEPIRHFVGMLTKLHNPLIEVFTFALENCSTKKARTFVTRFMRKLPNSFAKNPDGKPQVLMYDSSKPLNGFSALGHEYQKVLDLASGGREIKDGDLVVFQARPKPTGQYCLGSTALGRLRSVLWEALIEEGYMKKPLRLGDPGSLQFVWVTEFPMFKPVEKGQPDHGGTAKISASHHPFTAPLSGEDLELLLTHPLRAKSAAYDLVLNGVEIGGGSERIHIAKVQEFILRDVLKMNAPRLQDFSHLLEALRAGCPPHAGFALGFDRFVALMTDTATVRDVMAFPKTMKGEDLLVQSPSALTDEQLAPYGLQLCPKKA